ncbi:MAG: ABC transporter permease [Acidimicrobiia bacterium]|nr:ABC transporter permease [Acidimicrobiia bacterium]
MLGLAKYYVAAGRLSIQAQIQYRASTYFYLIGFLIEPVVYLVVWRTVAESQGGSIGGYSAEALTAYYIVWTLVRAMNVGFDPNAWGWRIQRGRLNELLSRPVHPFHRDFAWFGGGKFVWILLWLPMAAGLWIAFRPQISPTVLEGVAFFIAIWLAFAVRFALLWALGMITFWTTRGSAIFEIFVASELLLSGRLVPLELMPQWAQNVAAWLPFKWTFQFPIEVIIGRLSTGEVLSGLAIQTGWAAALIGVIWAVWKPAVSQYTAVGG